MSADGRLVGSIGHKIESRWVHHNSDDIIIIWKWREMKSSLIAARHLEKPRCHHHPQTLRWTEIGIGTGAIIGIVLVCYWYIYSTATMIGIWEREGVPEKLDNFVIWTNLPHCPPATPTHPMLDHWQEVCLFQPCYFWKFFCFCVGIHNF